MNTKAQTIGVPSVKGMQDAFIDYLVGGGGGLLYALSQFITGGGLIGSLIAPVLAGSVVKGARGTALATVAGFLAFSNALSGGTASAGSEATD